MFRILAIILASLLLATLPARGQSTMTPAQKAALAAGIAAETDPEFVGYRNNGQTPLMTAWLNKDASPATKAWRTSVPPSDSDDATPWTVFDSLVQGKRDSWKLFLDDPQDYTKAKIRNWVTDVWGPAVGGSNGEAILLAGTVGATNLQHALGGTLRSTGAVSALDLAYPYLAPDNTADWLVVAANCQ